MDLEPKSVLFQQWQGCSAGMGGNYVMVENPTHADIKLFIQNKSINNPSNLDR
jgi:hypothetical protein